MAAPTFETVAREWHKLNTPKWNVRHGPHVLQELENDVFPMLGAQEITKISAPLVLSTLRQIESRGAIDTARRLRQRISAVFVFGIASGICSDDPAAIVARAMAPMKVAIATRRKMRRRQSGHCPIMLQDVADTILKTAAPPVGIWPRLQATQKISPTRSGRRVAAMRAFTNARRWAPVKIKGRFRSMGVRPALIQWLTVVLLMSNNAAISGIV